MSKNVELPTLKKKINLTVEISITVAIPVNFFKMRK